MSQNFSVAARKKLGLPVEQQEKWDEHKQKKLFQTGSAEQASRYADHITRAAIHRKLRKKRPKGPLDGGL